MMVQGLQGKVRHGELGWGWHCVFIWPVEGGAGMYVCVVLTVLGAS